MVVLVALMSQTFDVNHRIPEFEAMFYGFGAELSLVYLQVLNFHGVQAYSLVALVVTYCVCCRLSCAKEEILTVSPENQPPGLKMPCYWQRVGKTYRQISPHWQPVSARDLILPV